MDTSASVSVASGLVMDLGAGSLACSNPAVAGAELPALNCVGVDALEHKRPPSQKDRSGLPDC